MTTFTIKATDLVDGLSNVLPHAADDSSLPVLAAVRVEVGDDGLVTFIATDRYTLAIAEHYSDPRCPFEPGEFLVNRGDAVELVKRAKAAKFGDVVLAVDGDRLAVSTPGATFTTLLVDGEFPKYRALLPEGDPVEVGVIGLGSAGLAKFAKLYRGGRALKTAYFSFTFRGAKKPIDVRSTALGDDYRALVMPVNLETAA